MERKYRIPVGIIVAVLLVGTMLTQSCTTVEHPKKPVVVQESTI